MLWTTSQLLELFIVLCTIDNFRYVLYRFKTSCAQAESKGGPIKPESMPTKLSVVITPIQGLTYAIVPAIYMTALVFNKLQQPMWMSEFALPDKLFGMRIDGTPKNTIRVLVSFASIGLQRPTNGVLEHLGDQFHLIGRREKPRVVQSGPYAWVRHPFYSLVLLQEALFSLVYWSYTPLFAVVAIAVVFAIKIPMEEEAIQLDEAMKKEYRAYMNKVPWKLVPFVW